MFLFTGGPRKEANLKINSYQFLQNGFGFSISFPSNQPPEGAEPPKSAPISCCSVVSALQLLFRFWWAPKPQRAPGPSEGSEYFCQGGSGVILWMDEIHFAPPNDSPVDTNEQWLQPWFHFVVRSGFRPPTVFQAYLSTKVIRIPTNGSIN